MTQDNHEKDFHNEIDDAIDNLFGPYSGKTEVSTTQDLSDSVGEEISAPTPVAAAPSSAHSQTDEFAKADEALLSLEWEISDYNIDKARTCLKEIQDKLDTEKAIALAEIFSLMEQIFDAMAVAPQSIPTSAPKTLKEGLQAITITAQSDDLAHIERNLIDPTLSELRSALPNVPKDYTKLLKNNETAQPAEPATPPRQEKPEAEPEPEELTLELPGQPSLVADQLIETINGHISILDKCIAKRIVPIENLFGKTPGYEKLHAIHKELHERMEKQKQILIHALGAEYVAGTTPPMDCPPQSKPEPAASPWDTVASTTWAGKRVAFIPEQIAYDGVPNKAISGPFLPLKNLKKGFFAKITSVVKGALNFYNESTLKELQVPVARAANAENDSAASTENVVIIFNDNQGMAFCIEQPIEIINISSDWTWTPNYDPNTMTAGELTNQDQVISVITIRNI
ncbi:MAG: hypothetical protein OEY01_14590 [Desulfobulbaceae bacterium]|nr:hypothetical protein [Desulfobulbaceae bacterium]HIJ79867.1 hypothetical protein [Deltaproteobacteria bacterium]